MISLNLIKLAMSDMRVRAAELSSFITPEGSKISHKNTKYDTKLHIGTHIHTVKH